MSNYSYMKLLISVMLSHVEMKHPGFYCVFRRNQNYTNILRFLNLGDKKLNPFDITHRFTHLFWFGDLNYRVDFPSTVSFKDRNQESQRRTESLLFQSELHLNLSPHRTLSTWCPRSSSSSTRSCSARTSSTWRGTTRRSSCISVRSSNSVDIYISVKQRNPLTLFLGADEEEVTFAPTYRFERDTREKYAYTKAKATGVSDSSRTHLARFPFSDVTANSAQCRFTKLYLKSVQNNIISTTQNKTEPNEPQA